MKIAMVSEHASPLAVLGGVDAGGQNVHVAALAKALGKRGHDVVVYTRRDDPALRRQVQFAPRVVVEHVDAGPPAPVSKDELLGFMDAFAADMRVAWRRWMPDLVHSHFWMSAWAALLARPGLPLPLAHTFHALGCVRRRHQGSADGSPAQRLSIEVEIIRRVDRLISTCSDEVFELRRLGARAESVSVVPCGVDLEMFRPDGERWERRPGWARVVVVSRLVPRKGIDDVIRAIARVPSTELLIAGGPPMAAFLEDAEARRLVAVAEAMGVRDRVRFLGRVNREDVPPLMRSADVVVTVPWYEPFGIVPVEAMACSVPVISSRVGGLVDTVVHERTGLLVPPRDAHKLADALHALLTDTARRRAYGEAGAARARARYGWSRIAASTLEAYELMLDGARGAAEEAL